MKVTNNNVGLNPGNLDKVKSSKTEGGSGLLDSNKTGGAQGKPGSESVNLSERAQLMQKAKDIAGKVGVDETKVARLQKMIDEGKYKTDADAIADKLVDEHLMIPD